MNYTGCLIDIYNNHLLKKNTSFQTEQKNNFFIKLTYKNPIKAIFIRNNKFHVTIQTCMKQIVIF